VNQLSISDKIKTFFSEIGLDYGKVENSTIAARHKYAHGGTHEGVELKKLVIIARSYEALLNRCILKCIGFNGTYRDYSVVNFPERALKTQLGG
jgi:hypothetical protein